MLKLYKQDVILFAVIILNNIPGVAKLLESPSHFSKFQIFREPQLNTYLKGIKKKVLKITEIVFIKNM